MERWGVKSIHDIQTLGSDKTGTFFQIAAILSLIDFLFFLDYEFFDFFGFLYGFYFGNELEVVLQLANRCGQQV